MTDRCALDSSRLSGTFGVHSITVGGILPYLGVGKGWKITKIVEISTSLTLLKMTDFSTFFENKPLLRKEHTWRYPNGIKNFLLGPKATNGYDESMSKCIRGCRRGLEILDITPKSSKFGGRWNVRNFDDFGVISRISKPHLHPRMNFDILSS